MNNQHLLEQDAKNICAKILNSEKLTETWRKHHFSDRHNSPAHDLIHKLESAENKLFDHPEDIKFMYELAQIHIGALSRASKNDDDAKNLKQQLENLRDFLADITYPTTLLEDIETNQAQTQILEIIEKETAQGPGPIKSFWNAVKGMAKHTYHDAKEFKQAFPKTTYATASTCFGAVGFSYMTFTPPTPSMIDPNTTCYTNYMEAMIDDDPDALICDQTAIIENVSLGCHDHLEQLMFGWKNGAEFIADTFKLDEKYYEHCTYIANNIYDANEMAQAIKENWHLRIDETVLEPVKHASSSILPDSTWQETMFTAMEHTHDFFKAGNDFENALHPLIAAAVAISVHKLLTKPLKKKKENIYTGGLDEAKEAFKNAIDSGRKSLSTPLNYILMTGGSLYAYNANNSLTEAVIGATIGLTAGATIHEQYKKYNAPNFAKESTITASKNLTSFSSAQKILSGKSASGKIVSPLHEQNWFNNWTNTKTKIALLSTTTLLALDGIATGGKVSASITGATLIGIPDLLYNLIEDPALHVLFMKAGAIIGAATAGATWGTHKIKTLLNDNDQIENDFE